MRTLIYSDVKATVAKAIGTCVTDLRVLSTTNDAQERLLNRNFDPVNSWTKYQICAGSSACLVWPRQIRTIKAFWVCQQPGRVVSEWFEALGYDSGGYGLRDSESFDGRTLIDRGTTCSFDNVVASTTAPKKIQAVASNASDNGKFITLRYFDSNGQRVYTSIDGVIQEGERIAISTAGTLTTGGSASGQVMSNGLYHVVKAVTNYPIRLYAYDVTTGLQTSMLAYYEPSETVPIYRSSLIPGISGMGGCSDATSECTANKMITVLARLQHVKVVVDNDPLVIGNLAALKLMARAIKYEDDNYLTESAAMEAKAMAELDGELSAFLGDGVLISPRFPDQATWGGGQIMNAI